MRLNEIQDNFAQLMTGGASTQGIAPLFSCGAISLPDRLSVYQNNVQKSLADTIIATYPVITALVGDDFMQAMSYEFIRRHPPVRGDLNAYGGSFATFVETFKPAQNLPYLPDVARLEWARNEAYYARDDAPLDPAALQNLPPEKMDNLVFSFRDSVRLLASPYPLEDIYNLYKEDAPPDKTIDITKGRAHIMITRPALALNTFFIEEPEYLFLTALSEDKTISESYVTAAAIDPNTNLADLLQKHFSLGTFRDFEIKT